MFYQDFNFYNKCIKCPVHTLLLVKELYRSEFIINGSLIFLSKSNDNTTVLRRFHVTKQCAFRERMFESVPRAYSAKNHMRRRRLRSFTLHFAPPILHPTDNFPGR